MTVPVVLAIAGVVALFLGIWGGGIKAKEIEIPLAPPKVRLIVGLIGFIFLGISIWLSAPTSTDSQQTPLIYPTSKLEVTETTNSPMSTISAGTILFAEDFEDNQMQYMRVVENSKILTDDTGNKILEIDNSNGSGYLSTMFGDTAWIDYEFDYRVKIISPNNNSIFVNFRYTCEGDQLCQRYLLSLGLSGINLYYDLPNANMALIEGRIYEIKPQTWYSIRIAVSGTNIKVYIDNSLVMDATDSMMTNGSLAVQVGPSTHVQLDDFLVIALGK